MIRHAPSQWVHHSDEEQLGVARLGAPSIGGHRRACYALSNTTATRLGSDLPSLYECVTLTSGAARILPPSALERERFLNVSHTAGLWKKVLNVHALRSESRRADGARVVGTSCLPYGQNPVTPWEHANLLHCLHY